MCKAPLGRDPEKGAVSNIYFTLYVMQSLSAPVADLRLGPVAGVFLPQV